MQHVSTYITDEDNAVLATIAERQGLSLSSLVRTMIRAACDAAPAAIKVNAAAALEEARENAGSLDIDELARAPWAGDVSGR